jgi:hypothetical protein
MKVLEQFQHAIENLHDVQTHLDITAFVVDEETRKHIPGARDGVPEQLFVCEHDDGVELALYIDPNIVGSLELDQPQLRLHPGNLESTCIALEGVSHFVFYAWCADVGRSVTALELELQAEVDKFALSWMWLADQGVPFASSAKPLLRQLFESYTLREGMDADEIDRYRMANKAALSFCQQLVQRYSVDKQARRRIRRDVRSFHRQGLVEKLRVA